MSTVQDTTSHEALAPVGQESADRERFVRWAKRKEARSNSPLARALAPFYRYPRLRKTVRKLIVRLEGGPYFSHTLRAIVKAHHGVTCGPYTYQGALAAGVLPSGTVVGAYASVSKMTSVYRLSHPFEWLSQHPFFYHQRVGPVRSDQRSLSDEQSNPLVIEPDAYVGDHTIILPRCKRIGISAIVGAGAVVTKDVPDFAIVAGNPARFLRWRFPEAAHDRIRASRWWDLPLHEAMRAHPEMTRRIDESPVWHPLLAMARSDAQPDPLDRAG